jgi:diadenosine tetraphosphate (Ap4A) HIT family hydrolase
MTSQWPPNWEELTRGIGCEMCDSTRPDSDHYGIRVRATEITDTVLQRANVQRGYTLVIWRGRHVNEPTELTDAEASAYWSDVLAAARALIEHYRPLKMNYQTLGNSLPHLHTHLIPRYVEDPAPGQPFPLRALNGSEQPIPEAKLRSDAEALRRLLN